MSSTYESLASQYESDLRSGKRKFPTHPIAWGFEVEQFNLPETVLARSLQVGYEAHRDMSGPWEFKIQHDVASFLNLKKRVDEVIGKDYWKWEVNRGASSHCHSSVVGPIRMISLDNQMTGTPGQWAILANTLVTFVGSCLPWFVFGRKPRYDSLSKFSQPVWWRYSEKEVLKILTRWEEPAKWDPRKQISPRDWKTEPICHNYRVVSWNRKNGKLESENPPKKAITLEIRLCEQHPYWIFPWMQLLTKIARQSMVHGASVKLRDSEGILKRIYDRATASESVWDCLKRSGEIEFFPGRGVPFLYSNKPREYKLQFDSALDLFRRLCRRFYKTGINSPIEYGRVMRMYSDGIDFDRVNNERPDLLWKVGELYEMCYGEHASDEHARRWLPLRDVEVEQ